MIYTHNLVLRPIVKIIGLHSDIYEAAAGYACGLDCVTSLYNFGGENSHSQRPPEAVSVII